MKILHTSDWHFGKSLEGYSRLEEQALFAEELIRIVEDEEIDLVLVAGDIYDTYNPPAQAEQLFYKTAKKIGNFCPIIIISGNHDNPERLSAPTPLALESGIIISARPNDIIPIGDYENFKIVNSGKSFFEIEIKGERAVILTISYPSEKRLNEIIYTDEKNDHKSYSDKMFEIIGGLSENFRDTTINILMGHFYIVGGEMENSERDISLGGNFSLNSKIIPENTHYAAMGHLHRPQKVAKSPIKNAFYSGSPIQYDKGEITHPKCVYISSLHADTEPNTTKVYLKNYKPIEIWDAPDIESAIEICENRAAENCFVYLNIKTDRVLLASEIRKIRLAKKDIVEINPILPEYEEDSDDEDTRQEKSIKEEFIDFYLKQKKTIPSDDLVEAFLKISQLEEEEI